MKSFKAFLAESTKDYGYVIRFATELTEGEVDRIERFLGKYDLKSISRVTTTPITKNPLFFKEVENTVVSKIDIKTGYPLAQDILEQQLADLLEMNIQHIIVNKEGYVPEEPTEKSADEPALLDSDYDRTSDDGATYGRKFVTNFLKSLSKKECVEVVNELSIKPDTDPAQEQMSIDDVPSKSPFTGDTR